MANASKHVALWDTSESKLSAVLKGMRVTPEGEERRKSNRKSSRSLLLT